MISFTCKCGKSIKTDDKYAGKKGKCPQCKEAVIVPQTPKASSQSFAEDKSTKSKTPKVPADKNKPDSIEDNKEEEEEDDLPIKLKNPTKTCSYCGEEILEVAKKCKHCEIVVDNPSFDIDASFTRKSSNDKNKDTSFWNQIKGFFNFDRMWTLDILKIAFCFCLILLTFAAIVYVFVGEQPENIIIRCIATLLGWGLGLIYLRLIFELPILLFKMNECLNEIKRRL